LIDATTLQDPCPVCRFDGDAYTASDISATLLTFGRRWSWTVDSVGADSALDELASVAETAIDEASDERAGEDVRRRAAHIAGHSLHLAGRRLRALGVAPASSKGRVDGLFASDGGVPKLPIAVARIGYRGVDGDRQAERRHHGKVWQALCLYSGDRIDALRDEGHPIAPGRAGENISVRGVEWNAVRPGVHLRIGPVLAEITAYATPCTKNARWFVDREFVRINHDQHPGWSRVYAAVLEDGVVRVGDQVVVEP
jgi:MOSC domain-containing protein YiiM